MKRLMAGIFAGLFLGATAGAEPERAVSFFSEVLPVLRQNCVGCHKPGKTKGGLDVATFATLLKGGKHGAALLSGKPDESPLIDQVSGESPEMPKDAEPLLPGEIALLRRWIAQGAVDDTPPGGLVLHALAAPPVYRALPSLGALAFSPDGALLAVAGFHEVLLWKSDGSQIVGRLLGHSPRIESLAFSPDGTRLATAGGAASEYGEIQIWNVAGQRLERSLIATGDSLFGVSFSPDGERVAVGCADKTVRAFSLADGRELMKSDSHLDWVYATAFTHDGKRLVSLSRDRTVKLIDPQTGLLIDDVNSARDVTLCLARHPSEDMVVFGDEKGGLRIYKMEGRAGRLAEGDNKENSFVRECDRMGGPVHALAWSPDGTLIAAGSANGQVQLFKAADGKRTRLLEPKAGPVFAVAFDASGARVAVAGFDGRIRLFNAQSGALEATFEAVPLSAAP